MNKWTKYNNEVMISFTMPLSHWIKQNSVSPSLDIGWILFSLVSSLTLWQARVVWLTCTPGGDIPLLSQAMPLTKTPLGGSTCLGRSKCLSLGLHCISYYLLCDWNRLTWGFYDNNNKIIVSHYSWIPMIFYRFFVLWNTFMCIMHLFFILNW